MNILYSRNPQFPKLLRALVKDLHTQSCSTYFSVTCKDTSVNQFVFWGEGENKKKREKPHSQSPPHSLDE